MKTTNIELLEIIAKPWCRNKDIMVLADCSEAIASKIRKKIEDIIQEDGKKLPMVEATVPMQRVNDFFEIDTAKIIKLAKIEAEINAMSK